MKKYKEKLFIHSMDDNLQNILDLLTQNTNAILLDLGCDSGEWSKKMAEIVNPKKTIGVDIEDEALSKARQLLWPVKSDLNFALPFKSNSIDVVHSNQVIEHLLDVDLFCEEIFRILRPGGYVVVSTENLSSWHNLVALFMGKQAFSQHISNRINIGNPMSIHYGKKINSSWAHNKIFSYFGLKAIFDLYNFENISILGAGYYPFWGWISRIMSRIDPIHTPFLTLRANKPR